MDIDRGLVRAVLKEGNINAVQDNEILAEMLEGSGKEAYDFLDAYWRKHGKLPTASILEDQIGVDLRDVPVEPVLFWATEIKKRHLFNAMQGVMAGVMDKLEGADSFGALEEYKNGFFTLDGLFKSMAGVDLIFDDVDDIVAEYEQAKLGIIGIPTPFPALNEVTQGWQPEDLIVIAGRPGQGKSTLAIVMAIHAWLNQRKVMVVSTEMSKRAIRRRFASFITKTAYGKLKRGKLTSIEEEKFIGGIQELKNDPRLLMMGRNMNATLESVEAQAMVHKPDMLVIDGFYLLRSSQAGAKNKHERIAELLDLTKAMAKKLMIPVMLTTQMNRGSEKGKGKPDLDRLAFSDNMGMIADYVFFLDRTQTMREAKEMRITPIKIREGEFIGSIISSWDFDKCEFHQRRVEGGIKSGGGGSAPPVQSPFPDPDPAPMQADAPPPQDEDHQGPW